MFWSCRSRFPQIPANNSQPRAGNVLPPPVDELYNNGAVSTKHSMKSSINVSLIMLFWEIDACFEQCLLFFILDSDIYGFFILK